MAPDEKKGKQGGRGEAGEGSAGGAGGAGGEGGSGPDGGAGGEGGTGGAGGFAEQMNHHPVNGKHLTTYERFFLAAVVISGAVASIVLLVLYVVTSGFD